MSKYILIVCVLCLIGTFLPQNVSYAQPVSQTAGTNSELKLAGDADARALFTEAKKYHDGDGVAQDFSKAHLLYLKAAGMGHNDARVNLGYLYFMGQGVEQDYIKARNWYLGAANNGDKAAQANLAMMYEHGLGVDKDPVQVKYWREFGTVKPAAELKIKQIKSAIPTVDIIPKIVPLPEPKPKSKPGVIAEQVPVILARPSPEINSASRDLRGSNLVRKTSFIEKPVIPEWTSNVLAGFMLLLALITAAWFVVQYTKLKEHKKAYVFAKAFYVHHRDQLRINYLRYPVQNRQYTHIDGLWAGALCTLMVKFAQKQEDEQDLVGEQSRKIVQALAQSSLKARQAVFPYIEGIQQKIFADIQAHDFKPESQLTQQLVQVSPARKVKISAITRTTNVVSLHTARSKKHLSIPPESLWPDTPSV